MTRIYVVDGDRDARLKLMRWTAERGAIGRPFATAADFMSEVDHLDAGIALIDLGVTGANGFDFIQKLREARAAFPIIAMSDAADIQIAVATLKRGAVDFLSKPLDPQAFAEAIDGTELILHQELAIIEHTRQDRDALRRLTPREREVLAGIAAGKTSKIIAREMKKSVRTIEAYRAGLIDKLGIKTTAEAVAIRVRYDAMVRAHALCQVRAVCLPELL